MVLLGKKSVASVTDETPTICRVLDEREKVWNLTQKKLQQEQLEKQLNLRIKNDKKLELKKEEAADWGGPFKDESELNEYLSQPHTQKENLKVFKTEIVIHREEAKHRGLTSKNFALNKLSNDKLLQNLKNILSEQQ